MGICASSPSDIVSESNQIASQGGNTDAASLIFSGNMIVSSKVILSFECKNLPKLDLTSKSDPFIVVYMLDSAYKWNEIGRTEVVVNSQDPVFVKKVLVQYKFEEIQKLKFVVYDADTEGASSTLSLKDQDLVGEVDTELPSLVHRSGFAEFPIVLSAKERGKLIVKCEELNQSSGDFVAKVKGVGVSDRCFMNNTHICSVNDGSDDEKNGLVPMYKTEISAGDWKEFSIDISILCNCDFNRPLIMKLYNYKRNGNHVLAGEIRTSVSAMFASSGKEFTCTGENAKGSLLVERCAFVEKSSFLQFVQSGLDINFMVAVDFTGSNGDPCQTSSLHYANPTLYMQGQLNQYERAIRMIGSVVEFYDTDRMFPVYGFGACLGGTNFVNHCFALTGNDASPEVFGVNGILDAYHNMLMNVRLSGPTYFAHVLSQAVATSQLIKAEKKKYLVLLIITDGAIHDMEDTIKLLVQGADMPLSVLIVGVGDDDFGSMETLDGDEMRLSYQGKVASRDIVQFVAMRNVANKPAEAIAQALLEEIPGQVTDYMKTNKITPSLIASLNQTM